MKAFLTVLMQCWRLIVIENVQERLPRLLALVPWLSARPGVTLSETADHFGVSIDQLTTDLYQLVVCGLPGYGPDQLVDIDFYDEEHIWVTDPQTLLKPMKFTAEEIIALSIAMRLLAQVPGLEFRDDIESLIAKLDRVGTGLHASESHNLLRISPQADPILQELIDQALSRGSKVNFEYHSGDDYVTHRVVSPVKVFAVDDHLYLDAYCDHAEARRLFRLDRVRELVLMPDDSVVPDDSMTDPRLESLREAPRAILELSENVSWLAEEPWVEVLDHNPLRISVPYLSEEWLLHWTLRAAGEARIMEPKEAAARLSALIESSISRIIPRV